MEASFVPGGNFVRIPTFPEEDRDVVPRADGQLGERDTTFYGPEWVRKQRARKIIVQTDLLYQFARMVAGETGAKLETYWRGGAGGGHSEVVDMMITNVMTHYAADGKALSADQIKEEKARLDAERRASFKEVDDSAMREHLERQAERAAADREASIRMPAVQREMRDIVTQGAASRTATAVLPPPGSTPLQAPAPLGPASSAPTQPTPPQTGRPAPRVQVVDPATQRSLAQAAAHEQRQRAVDGEGNLVYGINDKWAMLLRLMLGKATETQLKAWKMLYEPETVEAASRSKDYLQELRNLETIHKLLHAGDGDLGWVEAPQHTGYIFFSDAFGAGVAAAVSDVRGLAGKPWATELALMTHDGTRDLFAKLTALHMNTARVRTTARWGGTQRSMDDHYKRHGLLVAAFRRLTRTPDGYLTVPRSDVGGGPSLRRAEEARERRALASGRYLSDVY
jgi:hypothetical protein